MIRDRARAIGIAGPAALQVALTEKGCEVHLNTVSKWWRGLARPQRDRLEALLDVLGLLHPEERRRARELAYVIGAA